MSIEIGHRYVKDDVVVVIKEVGRIGDIDCVVYFDGICRALTVCEFLMKYNPYEHRPVYEYKWIQVRDGNAYETKNYYADVSEIPNTETDFWNCCLTVPLLKTKRERKCGR